MQSDRKNLGFTLIEVLVSLVILSIVLLGLLGGIITIRDINTRNFIRDEAIKASQEIFNDFRYISFDSIESEGPSPCNPQDNSTSFRRQLRNLEIVFGKTVDVYDHGSVKKIDLTLCWDYKGSRFFYQTSTLIRE